jgi:hypothetical protein
MMEDRIIETVGDLRSALEGIEDAAPFYLLAQIKAASMGEKFVVRVERLDNAVVLSCAAEK